MHCLPLHVREYLARRVFVHMASRFGQHARNAKVYVGAREGALTPGTRGHGATYACSVTERDKRLWGIDYILLWLLEIYY